MDLTLDADGKLRAQSLDTLQAFLAARAASPAGLSPADARRLWTGLFYALWMTDRPHPQQALAAALADLLFSTSPSPRPAVVGAWLRAFWDVLSAQWPRIDALRLDKFLLLVRRVFAAHVRYARARAYPRDDAAPDEVVALLAEACFDNAVAPGLRLHALDVLVDELERELVLLPLDDAAADGPRAAFVARLGALVDAIAADCPVKSVRRRAAETYADPRLPWARHDAAADEGAATEEDADDGHGWAGIED